MSVKARVSSSHNNAELRHLHRVSLLVGRPAAFLGPLGENLQRMRHGHSPSPGAEQATVTEQKILHLLVEVRHVADLCEDHCLVPRIRRLHRFHSHVLENALPLPQGSLRGEPHYCHFRDVLSHGDPKCAVLRALWSGRQEHHRERNLKL
eukprot:TRINITY_DN36299_c1_g4_i2.p1 TRINITY_DN36299_c1_g4~~TRINITY_DN36299_c1_g4_i2.p1  ORF type:complete len:150 (+),score=0.76 TRINITY_DN36299_c1_g4_i2:742-1191(+)